LRSAGEIHPFPIPLVHVHAVVVVQEIVSANGAHSGAQAFSDPHGKLFQRGPLPLGGRLDDLTIYGVFVVIVDDVELNGCAGTTAAQHIVHAALHVDDQRHGHHDEIRFLARVALDETLYHDYPFVRLPPVSALL
jgi:hypothetical protein